MKVSKFDSRDWTKSKLDGKGKLVSGPKSSYLKLKVNGDMVTDEFLNAIRRSILNFVPSYAFHRKDIDIKKNTTNLNNDMIGYRISQFPIFGIDVKQFQLEEPIFYVDKESDISKIEMFIKVENKTKNIMNVTTDDIELYVNDEKKSMYKKTDPILLLQLIPGSEFVCHAKASLGFGYIDSIWAPAQIHYYKEGTDNILVIKSTGQMTEKEILMKACKNLKFMMNRLHTKIDKQEFDSTKKNFIIEIENEDFTCSNLVNYYIQNNEHVDFCGLTRENHNIESVTFKIVVNGITISKLFKQAIKDALAPIEKFEDLIGRV